MTDQARQDRVEEIFHELLGLPDAERASRLRELCAGDAAMEGEVAELLRCLGDAATYLEVPAAAPPELVGHRLGQFRIIRLLGEGGMGQVYEAEQDFPSRRVALKLIRTGMASEAMQRRFEFEATALAQLQHPGIAQIFEAGFFQVGAPGPLSQRRPYLAMQLIDGVRLDAFVSGLGMRQILELVASIADGVQHAHQRGIMHRDLKPGNILVEGRGDDARARILDFGVARLTPEAAGEQTMITEAGQMIGTVAYMAPEQITGSDVDTRVDVYALGVILYELLAERLPHPTDRSSLLDAARMIAEQDARPLGSVRPDCRGDVSTIVSTAMARDRERRYGSAAELAADIRRYLTNRPIQARPATFGYLASRFAQRHKTLVASALAIGAIVIGSAVGMGVLYKKEQRQRLLVDAALKQSTREVARQKATLSLLVDDAFGAAAPAQKGMGLRVVDVLNDAIAAVPAKFPDDPAMRAHLRAHLSNLLCATAQHSKAVPLLELALKEAAPDDMETRVGSMLMLGYCDAYQGRLDAALQRFRDAITAGAGAGTSVAGVVEEAKLGVGSMLQRLERTDEAEKVLREIIESEKAGPLDRPSRALDARLMLASTVSSQAGREGETEQLLREAVNWVHANRQEQTPSGVAALHNWADFLMNHGRADEAAAIAVEAMRTAERMYPPNHVDVALAEMTAGIALVKAGKPEEGAGCFSKGISIIDASLDETQYLVEQSRGNATRLFTKVGDAGATEKHFAGWLRCRLLVAGADEGEGVIARFQAYRDLLVQHGAADAEVRKRIGDFLEVCRMSYPADSERRARLFANIARGTAAMSPELREAATRFLAEARAALQYSNRQTEDAAVIEAAESALAGRRN